MSREAYTREQQRLKQQRESTERIVRENEIRRLFPWEDEAAIALAREMAHNGLNAKAKIPEYYLK